MLPPQPHASLPIPQKRTLNGSSCPFLRRRSAIGLRPGMVQVLPPIVHLLHGPAADVPDDERLGADGFHQLQILVRADAVVFRDTAPVRVDDARPLLARTDAVAPVVGVGETAAGPANVGHLDSLERVDDVGAHLPRCRFRRP